MILYIDTTDNDVAELFLISGKYKTSQRFENLPPAEIFISEIKRFLKNHKSKLSDIQKIAVKIGPGFFSRVRTGVVAANSLAYALGIKIVPVVGKIDFKKIMKTSGQGMVAPLYGGKPNITKSKRKTWL